MIKRIEDYAHHVLNTACEFIEVEYLYRDKSEDIYYNSKKIANLNFFADDFTKERYTNAVHLGRPKTYNDLNELIRNVKNRSDLSKNEQNREVNKITEEIKDLIHEKYDMMAKNKDSMLEDIEKKKENKLLYKEKGSRLKNR